MEWVIVILVLAWPISGIFGWVHCIHQMEAYWQSRGHIRPPPNMGDYLMIPMAMFLGPITFLIP